MSVAVAYPHIEIFCSLKKNSFQREKYFFGQFWKPFVDLGRSLSEKVLKDESKNLILRNSFQNFEFNPIRLKFNTIRLTCDHNGILSMAHPSVPVLLSTFHS